MCERACFLAPRPNLESAPGPWRLHRHKTTLLSPLIATSESQESCIEWWARLAAQCLWSGLHLGTGQVDWTNTPLSVPDLSFVFMLSLCWFTPQSWSVGSWSPHLRGGAPGCGGPLGNAHELRGCRRMALCLHQWQVTFTQRQDTGNGEVAGCLQSGEGQSLKLFYTQMAVTCMYGVGMKVVSSDFHQGLSERLWNHREALKQVV